MATYIQGVTDYIPQVQPWSPDFNFYQNVLERKQNTYDANWEKLNSIYNSVLNAPMMRQENLDRRDNFFKNVEGELQRMASVDLSLPQNVTAASQVFTPFYESEDIVKDIAFTKTYQDEMQLAESYRKCTTEACKGKYWDGGVRAMQYRAQEFVDASDEEALRMKNPKYTPYKNLMKMATKAVKDSGISMKITSKKGEYLITEKNGQQVQIPLMNFLLASYGDDPELTEFYSTKAYLLTKEDPNMAKQIYNAALAGQGATQEDIQSAAKESYMQDTYENSKNVINSKRSNETNRLNVLNKKRSVMERDIDKNRILPDEVDEFFQVLDDIDKQEMMVTELDEFGNTISNTESGIAESGYMANQDQIRSVVANAMMLQDIQGAAVTLSYRDYERTMKADQFALEATRHSNAKELAGMRHGWDLQKMGYKYMFDKSIKKMEAAIKSGDIDANGYGHWSRSGATDADLGMGAGVKVSGRPQITDQADFLAKWLTMGTALFDKSSGMSTRGGEVEKLMNQGRVEEAYQIATGGPRNTEIDPGGQAAQVGTALGEQRLNQEAGNPDFIVKDDEGTGDENIYTKAAARVRGDGGDFEDILDMLTGDKINPADDKSERKGGVSGWRGIVESSLQVSDATKTALQRSYNHTNFKNMMQRASDASFGEDSDRAQVEFTAYGTQIQKNLKDKGIKSYADYQAIATFSTDLPNLSENEYNIIANAPTNTSNTNNLNAEYFNKIGNIGIDRLIQLGGGNDALYKFTEKGAGIYVRNPESGKILDRNSDAHNIINDQEYAYINNRLQQEAAQKFTTPGYVDSTISDQEREAAAKYEMFNNNTSFELNYGAGSDRFAQTMDPLKLVGMRGAIGMIDDAREVTTNTWNQGLKSAAGAVVPTSGDKVGDRIQNIVLKNIIKEEPGKMGRIASLSESLSALANNLDEIAPERDWFGSEWQGTIASLENNQAKDGLFDAEATLNLLSKSKYATRSSDFDLRSSAPAMLASIAESKLIEDINNNTNKVGNRREAMIQTLRETPFGVEEYLASSYNTFGITRDELGDITQKRDMNAADPNLLRDVLNVTGIMNINAEDQYLTSRQDYLAYLAKHSNAFKTERDGNVLKLTARDFKRQDSPTEYTFRDMIRQGAHNSGGVLEFDLNSDDAKLDEKYHNVFTEYEGHIAEIYSSVINNFSDQPSPVGGKMKDKMGRSLGNMAFAIPTTQMVGIDYMKNTQNKADFTGPILSDFLDRGELDGLDFNDENISRAMQALYAERNKRDYKEGKAPQFSVSSEYMVDGENKTRHTVTFLDDNWLKSKGFNKERSVKGKGTVLMNEVPMSFSFIVENPTDYTSNHIMPDTYDRMFSTMPIGGTYRNTHNSQYGDIVYEKTGPEEMSLSLDLNLFDPAQGKVVKKRVEGILLDMNSTDFPAQNNIALKTMYDMVKMSKQIEQAYRQQNGMTSQQAYELYAQRARVNPADIKNAQ